MLKKAKTKASRNVQFQSKLTQLASLSIPRLLPARACLGTPALTWKKHQSFVLGGRVGMTGWGGGGMRKEKSQGSISSGRARVLVLGFFLCLFSFVIKELKLLQGCRWMDNPIPAHSYPQSRYNSNHVCFWSSLDARVPSGHWEGREGHGLG